MALRELVEGIDGKLSHTKLWPNIASAAATVIFLYQGFRDKLTLDTWIVYLVCVGGYSVLITALAVFKGISPKELPNGNAQ